MNKTFLKIPLINRDERKKQVANALSLSSLESQEPSKETMQFFEQYIDGTITQDEILEYTLERYKQINEDKIYEVTFKKEILDEFAS